ncbi:MAG: hypothetical protein P9M13_01230 [Candidatus Ancaeobacter aquaticus]|nr:hypothetical protein [Candidatus Ancaeobacter aquaticus]
MTIQLRLQNHTYETTELKLAALILSEIPDCSCEIFAQGNSIRKTIKIGYPTEYKNDVIKLEKDFINKEAITNIYSYNKALNLIRDRLRGDNDWRSK